MRDMPRPRPPYLMRETTRHGATVWYVRRGKGPRHRIAGEFGSPEFMAAYQAALAGMAPPSPRRAAPKGTLRWLCDRWRESSDWKLTAKATQRQRDNILAHVLETAGQVPFRSITAATITAGRERRLATPFAANNFLKTMRALFAWAVEAGLAGDNPAAGVKMLPRRTEGFPPWSLEDVGRFRVRWPLGTRERLAMELLLSTGLRRGDAVRFGRQHVRDGVGTIVAEKTGETLHPHVLPDFERAIAAGPTGDLAFIVGENGRPRSKEGFGNWFHQACKAAGVGKSAHGLRKLAASMIAERGGTDEQMQAYFGWRSASQSKIYTRAASRRRLASDAAKLMVNESIPAPSRRCGDESEKPRDIKGRK